MSKFKNSDIIASGQRTISIESSALSHLQKSLDARFALVVRLVYEGEGRLILTGIGKSALVAQKIVATLNSTGTPALFLHAADAIHGDLGMIQPQDIVLCISKSGETPEIKVLIPLVRNMGNRIIAMTAGEESFLARHADGLLHTPMDKEADPNNLAPTVSTALQMALGDALAVALIEMRGFSQQDFAKYHPGGALGKQLYMRVSELYTTHEAPKVRREASLKEVIVEMSSKRLGAVGVVDDTNSLLGIITDGDLRRMLQKNDSFNHLHAADLMTSNPKQIGPHELAIDALSLMRQYTITQLAVTDEGKFLGIIHLHDLVKEGFL